MIPADRRAITDKESTETWSLSIDQQQQSLESNEASVKIVDEKPSEAPSTGESTNTVDQPISRTQETRKSKSKRVKSYLKRCKGALTRGDDNSCERKKSIDQQQPQQQQQQTNSAWYIDGKGENVKTEEEEEEEEDEVEDEYIFELCKVKGSSRNSLYEDAREELPAKQREHEEEDEEVVKVLEDDGSLNKCDSSDTLIAPQENKDDSEEDVGHATPTIIPNAVVSLIFIFLIIIC